MLSFKKTIGWLVVVALVLCGLALCLFVSGCRFLGLVLIGCAGLVAAFLLLHILQRYRPKVGKILLIILTVVVCIGLVVCLWIGILIGQAMFDQPDRTCQYLILLGAGLNGSTPSQSLQERIDAAAQYLQEHPNVQCILSGGQGPDEDISEAECMLRELTAMGISRDRLWLEDRSTSTKENIAFSLALIQEKTGSSPAEIGILSNEYHLYRAGCFAREHGVSPVGISAKTQRIGIFISYFVREIFAVCFYSVFG